MMELPAESELPLITVVRVYLNLTSFVPRTWHKAGSASEQAASWVLVSVL